MSTMCYLSVMLKFAVLLFILFFTANPAFTQKSISGKVVNVANGQPIAGSSVFISNTSKGTATDKNGQFELTNIPNGQYDLVVSSVGYETNVFTFSSDKLPMRLRFELEQKVRELENVVVEPSVEEGWDKWGTTFMNHFIGRTPNAARCKILNQKDIRFRFYRKSNRVIAYADKPLIIENRALGYRVNYQLENFEVNFKAGSSAFAGFPLFEAMDKNRRSPKSSWEKQRNKAYFGSMLHFMRSLYRDSLEANGFEIRRMFRRPNLEKERIKQFYRPRSTKSPDGHTVMMVVRLPDSLSADTVAYYERIMREKDHTDTYGREALKADSLLTPVEAGFKSLYFTDYLYITYKKETEDPAYLHDAGERRSPTFQRSYIWLVNTQPIAIDVNGNYFPPQELFSMAYWGWDEKIANMVPIDFEPPE